MPFRADDNALQARKEALEHALREIRDAQGQFDALKRIEAEREKELADVEKLLKSTTSKRGLPTLDNLRIAAPCNVPWESMKGDEHVRFCSSCEKNVYDLSSLTRRQAEALLRAKEGNLCVTYFKRADGTVLTADCPVGLRRRRLRNAVVAIASVTGVGAAAFGLHQAHVDRDRAARPEAVLQPIKVYPAVTVLLGVSPSDAQVHVNGKPATREPDGTIALVGPMGTEQEVTATWRDRSVTKRVLITGTGPFPSSLDLEPPPPMVRVGGAPVRHDHRKGPRSTKVQDNF